VLRVLIKAVKRSRCVLSEWIACLATDQLQHCMLGTCATPAHLEQLEAFFGIEQLLFTYRFICWSWNQKGAFTLPTSHNLSLRLAADVW
jgi:hypothetical protein